MTKATGSERGDMTEKRLVTKSLSTGCKLDTRHLDFGVLLWPGGHLPKGDNTHHPSRSGLRDKEGKGGEGTPTAKMTQPEGGK